MISPRTPTKADDGITAIARSLSARWSLKLPLKEESRTPSRDSRPEQVGDQIYQRIRFLFYRHREALEYVLNQFEEHAVLAFSQWQFKPHADLDVILNRSAIDSALRRDSFLKRPTITEDAAAGLTQILLRFLIKVVDRVKAGVDYKVLDELRGGA